MTRTKATRSASRSPRARTSRFRRFGAQYPAVAAAYEALGKAAQEAGPLDAKTRALVKLALATGAWREGAVHSQTRRALEAGCTPEDVRHLVVLATTTLGFPSMMAVMTWVEDVLARS
ncbi:MAG: carboxymuconolactone decarboxylase family protein [Planctomycetes bacterium]|nr:carboxymuconolactone decarboxylase family protein [Planctomycetota bacterium]